MPQISLAPAEADRIVILESLEAFEVNTGRLFADWFKTAPKPKHLELPISHVHCQSAAQFRSAMTTLVLGAANHNQRPWLHIECHGDKTGGLEFANGSILSWSELSGLLRELNAATKFNLLVMVSACFGFYLLSQSEVMKPSPAWCVVAPTSEIDPGEIFGGQHRFYAEFFKTEDLGQAVAALRRVPPSQGEWVSEPAEFWFERLMRKFFADGAEPNHFARRVYQVCWEAYLQDRWISIDQAEVRLRAQTPLFWIDGFFDQFFMVDLIPANRDRFSGLRARAQAIVAAYPPAPIW